LEHGDKEPPLEILFPISPPIFNRRLYPCVLKNQSENQSKKFRGICKSAFKDVSHLKAALKRAFLSPPVGSPEPPLRNNTLGYFRLVSQKQKNGEVFVSFFFGIHVVSFTSPFSPLLHLQKKTTITYKGVCHKLYKGLIKKIFMIHNQTIRLYVMLCYVIKRFFFFLTFSLQVIVYKLCYVIGCMLCYACMLCYFFDKKTVTNGV